jgi:hypothetical protein
MTTSADLPDLGLPRPEEAYSAFRSFVSQFDPIELLSQAGVTHTVASAAQRHRSDRQSGNWLQQDAGVWYRQNTVDVTDECTGEWLRNRRRKLERS